MKNLITLLGVAVLLAGCGGVGKDVRTRQAYQAQTLREQGLAGQPKPKELKPRAGGSRAVTNAIPIEPEAGATGSGTSTETGRGNSGGWGRDTGSGYTGRL